jgi:hypothetical protein
MVRIVLIAAVFAMSAACTGDVQSPTAPDTITVPVRMTSAAGTSSDQHPMDHEGSTMLTPAASRQHLNSRLSGREEVPVRDTIAEGDARFQLNDGETEIAYTLNVADIDNVTQAHIHLGPVGVNGGIVVWLYPSAPPATLIPGRSNGELSSGVITQSSLVGTLAGQPLSALINELRSGNAYVNVHTSQFPPGEIRGQVRRCAWIVAGC